MTTTRIHPTTAQTPQPPSTYLAQCSDRYIGDAEKYCGILRTTRKSGRLWGLGGCRVKTSKSLATYMVNFEIIGSVFAPL